MAHPFLYAKSVARAWIPFWSSCVYLDYCQLRNPAYFSRITGPWYAQSRLGIGVNLVFFAVAAWRFLGCLLRRDYADSELCMIAMVLSASVVQALIEFGENSRFSLSNVSGGPLPCSGLGLPSGKKDGDFAEGQQGYHVGLTSRSIRCELFGIAVCDREGTADR